MRYSRTLNVHIRKLIMTQQWTNEVKTFYNIATCMLAHSDWLIFYEKEMVGSQRWSRLTSWSVKFRLFSVKNVSLCYKAMDNVQRTSIQFGIHLDSQETTQVARDALLGSQRCSRASLTLPSCSPNYPSVSRIGSTHARHCPFLKETSNILFSITVLPTILHSMTINGQMK